jgi:PilZ domain-containing protein
MSDSPSERRSRPRVTAHLPVSITSKDGITNEGVTRDLSNGGIFLYSDSAFDEGTELDLVVVLPPELTFGEKRWVCCQARVVRVEERQSDGKVGVAASIHRFEVLPELL